MGKRRAIMRIPLLLVCLLACVALSQEPSELERSGNWQEAMALYARLPGWEYRAAWLGRAHPEEALALLPATKGPAQYLLYGDLYLALGDKDQALAFYQKGVVDRDYIAEPPRWAELSHLWQGAAAPWTLGGGSHRDNWLLRRYLALEAWQDADREYARMWNVHLARAASKQWDGKGLEFALDYAYYLNKRGHSEEALDLLLVPLELMDLDRNPDYRPDEYPATGVLGVSRKTYLRICYGFYHSAGKQSKLLHKLEGSQRPASVQLLAQLELEQDRPTRALELFLKHLSLLDLDPLSHHYRLAQIYRRMGFPAQASEELETCLKLPGVPQDVPDPDEEELTGRRNSSQPSRAFPYRNDRESFKAHVWKQLGALRAAQGDVDGYLESLVRQYENPVARMTVQDLQRAFEASGRQDAFRKWCLSQAKQTRAADPSEWYELAGDPSGAQSAREQWRKETILALRQRPDDPRSQLELLRLTGQDDTLQYWELRYQVEGLLWQVERILRACERAGRLDELRARGKRLLHDKLGGNLNEVAAILADHAEAPFLKQLLARTSGPARAQILRRLAPPPHSPWKWGWANLPPHVRALSCISGAPSCSVEDERYLYLGYDWGLAVTDTLGRPVTRVALGTRVRDVEVAGGFAWLADDGGHLFRLEPRSWKVTEVALPQMRVEDLCAQGPTLWIFGRTACRLDTRSLELEVLQTERPISRGIAVGSELWLEDDGKVFSFNPEFEQERELGKSLRLLAWIDGSLWVESAEGLCRVDPEHREVQPVEVPRGVPAPRALVFQGQKGERLFWSDVGPSCYETDLRGSVLRLVEGDPGAARPPDLRLAGPSRVLGKNLQPRPARDSLPFPPTHVLLGESQSYVGTRAGLGVLNRDFDLIMWLGGKDGLPSDEIRGAAFVGSRPYFAGDNQVCWFNPQTRVIRVAGSTEGYIQKLEMRKGQLWLVGDRTQAPFDTDSGRAGASEPFSPRKTTIREVPRTPLGFSEGHWDSGGRHVFWSSNGLVVVDGPLPKLVFEKLQPSVRLSQKSADRVEAERLPYYRDPRQLENYLASSNPSVRLKALEKYQGESLPEPVAERESRNPDPRARLRVLQLMRRDRQWLPFYRAATADSDKSVREEAALALVQLGERPPGELLAVACRRNPSLPAARLSRGRDLLVWVDMKPNGLVGEEEEGLPAALGEAVRESPEVLDELLRLTAEREHPFVRQLFTWAGPSVLPAVLERLKSPDRVLRAGAARVCAVLGNGEVIPALLQALDLESGLSRLAIVEALGKLRATTALPRLLRLYQQASQDEQRSASAGYRVSQLSSELDRHYESLQGLEGLGQEYEEARSLGYPELGRYLTADRVLAAIAEIDPNAAREFFCLRAVEGDIQSRELAAVGLGKADPTPRSLQALRILLADQHFRL